MGGILLRIKSWWDGADRTQRTIATVGGGFLAFLIVVTYLFASKPHMGLLVSGLSSSEQGTVVQELQKQGVPYEMDLNGNISVPSDKIPELRAKLVMAGKMPASGHLSTNTELQAMGYLNTPRVEKERLKSIAENELSESIGSLDGVETASVHLALGDDSPFVNEKKPTTASVTVFERGGTSISKEQARGIAMLVASSVPNLDPTGVTVLNRRGEALIDPSDQTSGKGQVMTKLETERLEAKRREREIQSKLDTAFGPGATIATVDLEIDFKGEKYDMTQRTPSQPLITVENTEKMTGGASGPNTFGGGTAGVGANTPGAPAAVEGRGTSSSQGYENKSKQTEYVMDEKTSHGEDPAGKLKSMTISVMADSKKIKDPKPVEDFVTNYLGARASDKNFVAKVSQTDFDTTAATAAADATKSAATRDRLQQIISLLPVAALVLVAFMVLRSIGKFAKTQTLVLATPDGKMIPLPQGGLNLSPEAIAQSGGNLQLGAPGQASSLPRTQGGLAVLGERTGDLDEDDHEVDSIRRKVNVPLEQIKKMSSERPEVVAMLIKSWLVEERR